MPRRGRYNWFKSQMWLNFVIFFCVSHFRLNFIKLLSISFLFTQQVISVKIMELDKCLNLSGHSNQLRILIIYKVRAHFPLRAETLYFSRISDIIFVKTRLALQPSWSFNEENPTPPSSFSYLNSLQVIQSFV